MGTRLPKTNGVFGSTLIAAKAMNLTEINYISLVVYKKSTS
jgi:hypothetical protein